MGFMRTVVLAEQISASEVTGFLNIGKLNSATTYLAGILEMQVNGGRLAAGEKADDVAKRLLSENFIPAQDNFSALSVEFLSRDDIGKTELFRVRMNRINVLTVFFKILTMFERPLASSEVAALNELYVSIFEELEATSLRNKTLNPALPLLPGQEDQGQSIISSLLANKRFFVGDGVLEPDELRKIFWSPSENSVQFYHFLIMSPDGIISGKVKGANPAGLTMHLIGSNGGNYYKTAVTDAQGNYEFRSLLDGDYKLVPERRSGDEYFNPVSVSMKSFKSGTSLVVPELESFLLGDHVDGSTIEFNGVVMRVKDGGITTAKLQDASVTSRKLEDNILIRGDLQVARQTTLSGTLDVLNEFRVGLDDMIVNPTIHQTTVAGNILVSGQGVLNSLIAVNEAVILGNRYPTAAGGFGQVLISDGVGNFIWSDIGTVV
ncbi:MAG: hypothetical protein HQL31_07425, partial [Planctomycetes bacterium]|nr:hypothetical protein [Planctomycetota bacterium]